MHTLSSDTQQYATKVLSKGAGLQLKYKQLHFRTTVVVIHTPLTFGLCSETVSSVVLGDRHRHSREVDAAWLLFRPTFAALTNCEEVHFLFQTSTRIADAALY